MTSLIHLNCCVICGTRLFWNYAPTPSLMPTHFATTTTNLPARVTTSIIENATEHFLFSSSLTSQINNFRSRKCLWAIQYIRDKNEEELVARKRANNCSCAVISSRKMADVSRSLAVIDLHLERNSSKREVYVIIRQITALYKCCSISLNDRSKMVNKVSIKKANARESQINVARSCRNQSAEASNCKKCV